MVFNFLKSLARMTLMYMNMLVLVQQSILNLELWLNLNLLRFILLLLQLLKLISQGFISLLLKLHMQFRQDMTQIHGNWIQIKKIQQDKQFQNSTLAIVLIAHGMDITEYHLQEYQQVLYQIGLSLADLFKDSQQKLEKLLNVLQKLQFQLLMIFIIQ